MEFKIVITSDGKNTLARMYDGKKIVKEAKAICSPDDTFDFETGAILAFRRLMETEKQKPEGLKIETGKKYKIKAFDDVKDHACLSKETWDKISAFPVLPVDGGEQYILCDTNYHGQWDIPREAFECEWNEEVKEKKPEFKVGDLAEIVSVTTPWHCFAIGTVVRMKEKYDSGRGLWQDVKTGQEQFVRYNDLKKIEF